MGLDLFEITRLVLCIVNVHFYCLSLVFMFSNTRSCQTILIVLNAWQTIIMQGAGPLFSIMTAAIATVIIEDNGHVLHRGQ